MINIKQYIIELSKSLNIRFILSYKEENLEELLVWLDAYQSNIEMEIPNNFFITEMIFEDNIPGHLILSLNCINSYEFDKILQDIFRISEDFLEKFADKFDEDRWGTIALCQALSDKFIEKHRAKLDQEKLNLNYNINARWRTQQFRRIN